MSPLGNSSRNARALLPRANRLKPVSTLLPRKTGKPCSDMIFSHEPGYEKEITVRVGWCHLGDALCCLTVARQLARRFPHLSVYVDGYADIVRAYGDDLIHMGSRGAECGICPTARHRRQEPTIDYNYCGTYENEFGFTATPGSRLELPEPPPFPNLEGVKYIAFQPFARWAKPDLSIETIQKLIQPFKNIGLKIVCVGTWETRQHWEDVDYSHLGSAIDLIRVIRHATAVLTPRSASAHVAGAFKVPSLIWVPKDGENWHLNYTGWPNVQISVFEQDKILEQAQIIADTIKRDKNSMPKPETSTPKIEPQILPCEPTTKPRTAIVTMAIGEQEQKVAAISHPLMKAYANRINADFHVITQRKWPDVHIFFEKHQICEIVKAYDRTLYVDTDIMIRDDSPNIFNLVPVGKIGAFNETSMIEHIPQIASDSQTRIVQLLALVDGPPPGWIWPGTYFNAGVQVVDPSFAWLYEQKPEGPFRNVILADQGILNLNIHHKNLPTYQLPQTWNHMIGHTKIPIPDVCASSYFIHATWYKDKRVRDQVMRMIDSEWKLTTRK